ncbi:MAG: autotransporter-associated beta strand repeat-containing protein [Chthoniobacterales bacterium]|nr:autotransporter-associated beta strand repeat-containing protein [Chthoniobacterales bacterium]
MNLHNTAARHLPTTRSIRSLQSVIFFIVAAVLVSAQSRAATLLSWDVTGTTGTSSGAAATASVIGVSGSAMTAGAGTLAGNISNGVTSPANTWNRTYSLFADPSAAQTANSFITWTSSVSEGYTLTVSSFTGLTLAKTSAAGPTSAELYYSTDGTTFTKLGNTASVSSTLTSAASAFGATLGSAPLVVTGAVGGTTITWRLVGYGASGRMGIGHAGTDNFSILGTVTGGAAKDLVWAGGTGDWNTTALNWKDSNNVSVAFAANDNVSINGGAVTVDAAGVTSGSVSVGGSDATSLSSGSMSGTSLAKTGSGNLVLSASNSFSGGSSVTGGTLTLSHNKAIGAAALSADGATLAVVSSAVTVVSNNVTIGTNDLTLFADTPVGAIFGGTFSASGTVSGVGIPKGDTNTFNVLTKTGAGTVTFTNNVGTQMTYTTGVGAGVTTSGGLQLNISNSGVVVFNGAGKTNNLASGTLADVYDTNTVPPVLLTNYNGMVWDGNFVLQAGTVQINGGNIRGAGKILVTSGGGTIAQRLNFNSPDIANDVDVASGSTLTLSAASGGSVKLFGQLTGAGTIVNAGSGGASLDNTNPSSFTGLFNVAQSSAGSTARMTVKAQTLASATSLNFLTAQAGIPKLTIENSTIASGAVVACPITGPGELTKAYDGDIVLAGSNTFSGGLVVQDAGTVYVNSADSLGAGPLVAGSVNSRIGINPGAVADEITITNDVNTWTPIVRTNFATNGTDITTNITTTLNVMAFAPGTNSSGAPRVIQLNSRVTNAGLLKISGGGYLHVNSLANSYTGGTEIGTGVIFVVDPAVLSTGPVNFGTISNSFLHFTDTATLTNSVTISGIAGTSTNASFASYTANFDVDAGLEIAVSSAIADKAPVGTNATDQKYGGRVEKWGDGTLVLAASNSFSQSLAARQGVLVLSDSGAIGRTNAVFFRGGTMRLAQSSGDLLAGQLEVEAASVLDLGSGPARTIRFASLASTLNPSNPATLTITNTGNGSVYFPTNTAPEDLAQLKSAENPAYTATLDQDGLLVFSAGVTPPSGLSYAPSSVTGTVGLAIMNMVPSVTGNVDSYGVGPALPAGLGIDPATGIISGTPSAASAAATYTVTASNAGGSTTAEVSISVVTAYDSWAAGYGLDPATSGAPAADPDKDGLNNNSEYVFGTNPTTTTVGLLTTSVSGGSLTISWIERDSGFTYNVQSSPNLNTGFANDGAVSVGASSSQAGVPSGCTRKQFTVPATGNKFYRVRATPGAPPS